MKAQCSWWDHYQDYDGAHCDVECISTNIVGIIKLKEFDPESGYYFEIYPFCDRHLVQATMDVPEENGTMTAVGVI